MERKGLRKSLAIIFMILVVFGFSSNTIGTSYAAINSSYSESYSNTEDPLINDKIGESVILNALGIFVYSVASLVEKIVGNIFTSVTGESTFPWADRIIFNAIPLLDVNFFNPSSGSFFVNNDSEDTLIAKIVRNTYFTVLAICIAFLTIVVAISAIRMALTTLASEKAKYKEAITKWMFSIVLIFLMHNLMSFIFYLNEALVEVASNILLNNFESVDVQSYIAFLQPEIDDETRVQNFIDSNKGLRGGDSADEILSDEKKIMIASELLQISSYQNTVMQYASDEGFLSHAGNFFELLGKNSVGLSANINWKNHVDILNRTVYLVQNEDELQRMKEVYYPYKGKSRKEMQKIYESQSDTGFFDKLFSTKYSISDWAVFNITMVDAANAVRNAFYDSNGNWRGRNDLANAKNQDIIKNLASYFKSSAYTYTKDDDTGEYTGWRANKISVSGALLYAIFVAQSILYFFSYTKRFFYIIVLSLLAPIVVLFDFLGKAIS